MAPTPSKDSFHLIRINATGFVPSTERFLSHPLASVPNSVEVFHVCISSGDLGSFLTPVCSGCQLPIACGHIFDGVAPTR